MKPPPFIFNMFSILILFIIYSKRKESQYLLSPISNKGLRKVFASSVL